MPKNKPRSRSQRNLIEKTILRDSSYILVDAREMLKRLDGCIERFARQAEYVDKQMTALNNRQDHLEHEWQLMKPKDFVKNIVKADRLLTAHRRNGA